VELKQSQHPILRFLSRKEVIPVLRTFLGVVFVWASIHKILYPELLAATARSYEILPVSLSNLFAIFLAWSELFAGVFLILGVLTRPSALVVTMLLFMFIVAISATMIRGLVIDCGCFDEKGHRVDAILLARNLLLILLAILIYRFDRGYFSLPLKRHAGRYPETTQ
jgi:putative oxidoreductase